MSALDGNSLEKTLDLLHAAARAGDIVALGAAGVMLEADLTTGAVLGNPAQIARLREKALRNQVILQAVARGIRAAQRRLDDIRSTGKELKTYDQRGKPRSVPNFHGQVERRV